MDEKQVTEIVKGGEQKRRQDYSVLNYVNLLVCIDFVRVRPCLD